MQCLLIGQNSDNICNLSTPTVKKRRDATWENAKETHGDEGALNGLWTTFISKVSKPKLISLLQSSGKVTSVLDKVNAPHIKALEKSKLNQLRSTDTLYSGGTVSKRKWNHMRKSNKLMPGVNYVPYNNLREFINAIPRPAIEPLPLILGNQCDLEQMCVALAMLYGTCIPDRINWFGERGVFHIAYGGDGAPFGKYTEGTSFLISILNVVQHVHSCDHNFTVVGGQCHEDSEKFLSYLQTKVTPQMEDIEGKEFLIPQFSTPIRFRFSEFLADQKFQASTSGELTNAARYPSSFANIQKDEIGDLSLLRKGKTYGDNKDVNYWHPWDYEECLKNAKEVEQFKSCQKKDLKEATIRKKVLDHIACKQSRQEYIPSLGIYSKKKRPDPLHLKNNAVKGLYTPILTSIMNRSKDKIGSFDSVEKLRDCPLKHHMLALKAIGANILLHHLEEWLKKSTSADQFQARFNGETSYKVMSNFAFLLKDIDNAMYKALLANCALQLRDVCGLMAKVNVGEGYLQELEKKCRNFYVAKCLVGSHVSVSDWTIGLVVPVHGKDIYNKYGLGYGLVSMQGREAKNTRLKGYIHNTNNDSTKWEQVLKHEFIHTVFLPQEKFMMSGDNSHFARSVPKYSKFIPENTDPEKCYCGNVKNPAAKKCQFCQSKFMLEAIRSCEKLRLTPTATRLLNTKRQN